MNQRVSMFGVAVLILTLITAVILGFAAGPASPLTWLLVAILIAIPYLYRKYSKPAYLEWKQEYSVGIDSIDQEHKKLVHLINQLQTAVDYSAGAEFEQEALDELVDYTKTHFSHEEDLMEKYEYPDFEPHKAQHKEMIAQVEKVLDEYKHDEDLAMRDAHTYLKGWLINHINGTDQQYSAYLREKGVK